MLDVDGEVLVKKVVEEGVDIVVVCGGDGIIIEVVSVLVDMDIILGIILLGIVNVFC